MKVVPKSMHEVLNTQLTNLQMELVFPQEILEVVTCNLSFAQQIAKALKLDVKDPQILSLIISMIFSVQQQRAMLGQPEGELGGCGEGCTCSGEQINVNIRE